MNDGTSGGEDSWLNTGKGGREIRADVGPPAASPDATKPETTQRLQQVTAAPGPDFQKSPTSGTRGPLAIIVGGAVILALIAVGVVVATSGGTQTASDGGQGGADGLQEVIQRLNGSAGVWYGTANLGSGSDYLMTLSLEADDDGQVDGIVRMRSEGSGNSGTWRVSGVAEGDQVTLDPGAWVGKSRAWTRDGFTLSLDDQGSLIGTASGYGNSDVSLDQIGAGPVTMQMVMEEPRAALATDNTTAIGMLEELRDEGLPARDTLDYEWVPQVGSGCAGLWTSLGQLTAGSLLSSSASMAADHDAVTVRWEDVGTETPEACPTETMWVIIVPEGFESAAGAKRWCRSNGFSGGSCAARYLVPRGERGTQIEYL